MSDVPEAAAPAPKVDSGPDHFNDRVLVRPYPKVIFFWMTWVMSLVAGIIASTTDVPPMHLGTVWMCIFAFNLLVISFDFTEVISVMILALIAMVIFAGLYMDFLSFIGDFFRSFIRSSQICGESRPGFPVERGKSRVITTFR